MKKKQLTSSSSIIVRMIEKGYTMTREGKLFSPKGVEIIGSIDSDKYRKTNQRTDEGKSMPVRFHRIQGYLKFGDRIFEDGMQIRHLDGDHENNSWDNLEIGTNQDNQLDIPLEKRRSMASHPKHNHIGVIQDFKEGMSKDDIMTKYNIPNKSTVNYIINKSLTSEQVNVPHTTI